MEKRQFDLTSLTKISISCLSVIYYQSFTTSGLSSGNGLPNFLTSALFEKKHTQRVQGLLKYRTKLKPEIPKGMQLRMNLYALHMCALVSFSGRKTGRCSSVGEHRPTAAHEMPPEDCGIDSLRVACLLERVASHETLLLLSYFLFCQCQLKKAKTLRESFPVRKEAIALLQHCSDRFSFFESERCASERFQGALHWVSFTFSDEQDLKLKSTEWDRSVKESHFCLHLTAGNGLCIPGG